MPKQHRKPAAANSSLGPVPATVVPFPVDLYMRARLHHRCIRSDSSSFWEQVRQGYAVAVKGSGTLDAIWVRDNERWAKAATRYHDLPIKVAGELRLVNELGVVD